MAHPVPDHTHARWFTSSYSSGNAECVEAAFLPGRRLLRDSKLGDSSPVLAFSPQAWREFTAGVEAGQFDLDR